MASPRTIHPGLRNLGLASSGISLFNGPARGARSREGPEEARHWEDAPRKRGR